MKQDLIDAVYNNLYGFYDFMGLSSQAVYHKDSELTCLITKVPFTFLNQVYQARFLPEQVDEKIEAVDRRFAARGVRRYAWLIGLDNPARNLADRLVAAGFVPDSFYPGMAVNLKETPGTLEIAPGTAVRPGRTADQLMEWTGVLVKGFGVPDSSQKAMFDLLIEQGFDSTARYYTAFWQGAPAACSMLLESAGAAGIYCVATLPEARGKGLGTVATRAALLDAREIGCEIAILLASRMGFPIYLKLGFRKVCDMEVYEIIKE